MSARRIRLQAHKGLGLAALEKAIADDRVSIVVQPQFDLVTGALLGVETLARLTDENGVEVLPAEFIPLAERTGLYRPLGRRLFHIACKAACQLAAIGRADVRVAINLSARQLSDPAEIDVLLGILASSGASPCQLEVELTESAAIKSFAVVHSQLQRFRALGATVAIDDFGTGFASLEYLLELDVDRLKIDRLFIAALGNGLRGALTDAMIKLCHTLSLDVIAEGVETEFQAAWLRQHDCRSAQGFLLAKPLSFESFMAGLDQVPLAYPAIAYFDGLTNPGEPLYA